MEAGGELRELFSQNMPEKPETCSYASPAENIPHEDPTVGHTAEMMKSKTKQKFDEPKF